MTLAARLGERSGAVLSYLPRGNSLPDDAWVVRHRVILGLIWAQALGLTLYAVYRGYGVEHGLFEGTAVVSVPLLVEVLRITNRSVRSTAAGVGLITSSAVLTHLSGGYIEAHFHFFVMLAVIALYQNWVPFLLSIGYVVVHHGLMGALAPESVYNHPDAIAHPWKWAAIHASFVSAACAAYVVAWRLNEASQRAVQESEVRFRRLAEHSPIGIYHISPDQSQVYLNPAALAFLEVANADDVRQRGLDSFFTPASMETVLAERQKRKLGIASTYEAEIVGATGTRRTVLVSGAPLFEQELQLQGTVGTIADITDRKKLEEALRHQAFHDPLTRLANRARFADRLEHALERSQRDKHQLAVLFLDLDNFKEINDRFGHSVGDLVLVEVARRLEGAIRPGDTAARFGGDEFAILLEDLTGSDEARAVADRLLAALQTPIVWDKKQLVVAGSLGIVISGSNVVDTEALLRNADVAMYVAKNAGKGRCEIFEEAMHVSIIDRLDLLGDMQHAVDRDELVLHYQPTVALQSGNVVGVEALLRWNHPTRGLLLPSDFIPLAEESDAIVSIGRWVLREACFDLKRWRSSAIGETLSLSVNVSVRQLERPEFAGEVRAILDETGIPPRSLVLEVTESLMLRDVDMILRRLEELKALGVRLAIDDFGTGYSSLSYLSQFPFDILKIDKSFVDGAGAESGEQQLMPAIIDLGKMLKMQTIAEGIERPEQLARLNVLECDLGQGFLFAKPLPALEIEQLLRSSRARSEAA